MKILLITNLLAVSALLAFKSPDLPIIPGTSTTAGGYKLVWSDEFTEPGLPDSTKWGYEVGGNGWGNNELQYYTARRSENARIENGKLIIEARKEAWEGKNYTSARLVTKGKVEWKHGRIEALAKLPTGRGTWPAIWMLGSDISKVGWPRCGEIDIMEHVGFDEGVVHGTIHTEAYNHGKKTQKGQEVIVKNVGTDFHLYAIEWTADKIDFFVDNQKYYTVEKATLGSEIAQWPFEQPFFLILNMAVGGNWGGQKGVDENIWPQRMEVDYVRVYQ
ncbi:MULTISPECIES: glycoside hydrolase family 16 protein [unclassified Spirosoma]|uniref:glycoside hydrolase family 16 protein n=1 Tax=unclassified Spirosoma TaxID=2621999 RepID=UPI00096A08E8|nr:MULTISPECIES: glycoside hydrolase family 16 protein [unclassified Spirosoma]MBN8821136.1 glycoside hydrolase family 16 protein [Spirosoma sp.]OJW79230.1 MAG: glycoside hydrolase [Spirosoma sp. 48-14]